MLTKKIFFPVSIFIVLFSSNFSIAEENSEVVEELIVIGSRLNLERAQLGSTFTVMSAADINKIGAPYLADVLRHVPGLAVSRTGPGGGLTQVRIRGAEANHVLVIIDGVEANSTNGEFDFSILTTDNIERIEILRGPQSGLYGSNATAGVISIVTNAASNKNAVELAVETGTLDFDKQNLIVQGVAGNVEGALSFNQQTMAFNASESGDEQDKDDNFNGTGKGLWRINDNLTVITNGRYLLKNSDLDGQDFSGGPDQGLAIDSPGFAKSREKSLSLAVNWQLLDNTWRNTISIDRSRFENEGSFFSNTRADYGSRGDRQKIALVSAVDFGKVGAVVHRGTVFIENEEESYRNTFPFDPSQLPKQRRRLSSVGIEYFAQIAERFNLSAALRQDNNDNFEDAASYRLAARYLFDSDLIENSNLHASLGTGISNPSFFEQFGFVPGFYLGNPNLEPEQQRAWDMGWEKAWADGNLLTDVTYFDAVLEQEITGFFTPINATTESERHGVELSFSWHGDARIAVSGAYTYTDAKENEQEEIRRPKNTASLDNTFSTLSNKINFNLGLVYNGEMIDNDFRTFSRTDVDSYLLVNVSLNYEISRSVSWYLRVNNLLDQDYQEVIGFATPGIYGSTGLRLGF